MPPPKAVKQDAPPAEERKLMPWEGGEPEIVDVHIDPPDGELLALLERRRRGHMTPQEAWVCILKSNAVHGMDGKIYRFHY
ncbi:MAG TPA: hypothetical protein VKB57_02395 [Acidimicrobiales bacterium]|nr:hypothetical protein [Acidimicrobiales bacterium]